MSVAVVPVGVFVSALDVLVANNAFEKFTGQTGLAWLGEHEHPYVRQFTMQVIREVVSGKRFRPAGANCSKN